MDYSAQSFERLYKDSYRLMYRLAYSMVEDAEDARDVVSQVFTLVWHHKPKVEDGAERGYLLSATRNQCLHLLRHRERRQQAEQELRRQPPDTPSADQRELLTALRRAISEQLTEQDRRVLELHYDHEMTYHETASALGISPSAVNKHITQALGKLRLFFSKPNKP